MTNYVAAPVLMLSAFILIAADGPSRNAKSIVGQAYKTNLLDERLPATPAKPIRKPISSKPKPEPKSPVTQVAIANRLATLAPAATGFVNASQIYPFSNGIIYQVYAAPERVTDISLQPGESLIAVASGDTVRWVIGDTTSGSGDGKRTHILIKPYAPGLRTNLVVTTDRRTYHLALISTAGEALSALSWTYPQDELIALKRERAQSEAAKPVAAGINISELRFNYSVSGDKPSWRPLRVFDDRRQTFIQFGNDLATGEAPPLFIVDGAGQAQLVNYRVSGQHYIVDRIFDVAELRLGLKDQQVVRITRLGAQAVKIDRKAR